MGLESRVSMSEVFLMGSIDEHAPLEEQFRILDQTPGDPLIVNLQGILRINSIGVRRWIPFITRLGQTRRVRVEAMSYPLVMQANMLMNLMAGVRIASCMAPYFCATCEANRMILVTAEEVAPHRPPPPRSCPECGTPMEFDELDNYFGFLSRSP